MVELTYTCWQNWANHIMFCTMFNQSWWRLRTPSCSVICPIIFSVLDIDVLTKVPVFTQQVYWDRLSCVHLSVCVWPLTSWLAVSVDKGRELWHQQSHDYHSSYYLLWKKSQITIYRIRCTLWHTLWANSTRITQIPGWHLIKQNTINFRIHDI